MRSFGLGLLTMVSLFQAPRSNGYSGLPELQVKHILVVTVLSVNPTPWQQASDSPPSESRTLSVGLRLEKILRGEISLPAGETATVNLQQIRYRGGIIWDNPEFWSYRNPTVNQSYLILSNAEQGDIQKILQRPEVAEEVQGSTDVDDIEFILNSGKLPATQQVTALASRLEENTTRHGWPIAEYAAELLNESSQSESSLRILEGKNLTDKLTEKGQYSFLAALYRIARTEHPKDAIVKILAVETMRALLSTPAKPISKLQLEVVQNYLPWLIEVPSARAQWEHGEIAQADRARAITALQGLSASGKILPKDQETLAKLREILSKN